MFKIILKLFFLFFLLINQSISEENIMILKLKDGDVKIELFNDVAPNHVKRIKELASAGKYDGVVFHRVIDSNLPHDRGTLSMARSSNPNSANSQFFICFKPAPFLDKQYTVFGKVIEGMEFVDKIKRGDENNNGAVSDPDKIISFK